MGVLDKFLDLMKLSDDDEFDYEVDDYEYEDEEFNDKPSKKNSFFNNKKSNSRYDEFDDEFDDQPVSQKFSKPKTTISNKVTPMRSPSKPSGSGMGVCVIKPTSIEDGREICETLLDSRTVILNLEGMDLELAQRIIDFTSGATYAMKGNLRKISNYIFLVTPDNVDISGDLQDILGNSFDASSIRNRF